MSKSKFKVIKYENGVLTTVRDSGYRWEDFYVRDDGIIDAAKHYGDHEWDSVGTVESVGQYVNLSGDIVILRLLAAAADFHARDMPLNPPYATSHVLEKDT